MRVLALVKSTITLFFIVLLTTNAPAQEIDWVKIPSISQNFQLLDVQNDEIFIYQYSVPNSIPTIRKLIVHDKDNFQEKERINLMKSKGKRCEILSVSPGPTEVELLQRCRRKGGITLRKSIHSREKKEMTSSEDIASIGSAEGKWEDYSILINNDSLLLYKEVDNTRATQTDHYYLFNKKQKFELTNQAVIERSDKRKTRETIINYAISEQNKIAYLQKARQNSAKQISLQVVTLDGKSTKVLSIPGDRYDLISTRLAYLKDGDFVVVLAESKSKNESIDRIRLLKGNPDDGIKLERLIDIPELQERKRPKLTKHFRIGNITEVDRHIILRGFEIKNKTKNGGYPSYNLSKSVYWILDKEFKTLDHEVIYLNLQEDLYPRLCLSSAFYNYEHSDYVVFHNVGAKASLDNFRSPADKTELPSKKCTLMSWYFNPDGGVINQQFGIPGRYNVRMNTLLYDDGYIYMIAERSKGLKYDNYIGRIPISYAF